jgi:hypothetical protein
VSERVHLTVQFIAMILIVVIVAMRDHFETMNLLGNGSEPLSGSDFKLGHFRQQPVNS